MNEDNTLQYPIETRKPSIRAIIIFYEKVEDDLFRELRRIEATIPEVPTNIIVSGRLFHCVSAKPVDGHVRFHFQEQDFKDIGNAEWCKSK